jgi:hypothetical protein
MFSILNPLFADKIYGFMDYELKNNQVISTISFINRGNDFIELDINARTATHDCIWTDKGILKNNIIKFDYFNIQLYENNSTISVNSNNSNICGFNIDGMYSKKNK